MFKLTAKTLWFSLTILVVVAFVHFYAPPSRQVPAMTGGSGPIILAHRGSRVLQPENTLLAFQNALEFGADVVETDVQLTRDRQLIVFHDDRVDRVTDREGRVSDFTLEELMNMDAGYRFTPDNGTTFPFRGKGIRMPTPDEVLDTFPDAYFNIELKDENNEAAALLHKTIVAHGRQRQVSVSSRWCSTLQYYRSLFGNESVATSACEGEVVWFLLHAYLRTSSIWYSLFSSLQPHSLQVPVNSGPFRLDNSIVLEAAKQLGKHVHFWVINDPNEMRRLVALGAHGIITDRPDIAVAVFESLGIKKSEPRKIMQHKDARFFIPIDNHIELHTCVGFVCTVLQNIFTISIVCFILGVILLWNRANKKEKIV